ncbi:hypothetical protein QFZ80_005567 [Paenibacillus sp. V4I7]|nr:hypothetical protein [Paenibacillus sp. V4I7]
MNGLRSPWESDCMIVYKASYATREDVKLLLSYPCKVVLCTTIGKLIRVIHDNVAKNTTISA